MTPFGLPTPVAWTLSGVFGILIVASAVSIAMVKSRPDRNYTELRARTQSWWMMVIVFSLALVSGIRASLFLLGFVSFLALKEFLSLIPTRRADRRVLFWAYLAIPLQYYWVSIHWYGMFIVFIPVYMLLLLSTRMILIGQTDGFLRAISSIHFGLMTTVFALSHAACLLALPSHGQGLLLTLLLLTELNDVAQYLFGKAFGRRRISPTVSPGKTWGGFLGGVGSTVLLSMALAPRLTPIELGPAAAIGLLVAVGGFFGDLTISAVKRDLGVKDSGTMLRGHGGILDRVDSLGFTAPLFFHAVYYAYY